MLETDFLKASGNYSGDLKSSKCMIHFFRMITREEILAIYEAGPDVVVELFMKQEQMLQSLRERIEKLEAQLGKNSQNSSKPPSSDGLKRKNRSLRTRSGRKPGGQEGHKGSTLSFCEKPTEVKDCPAKECSHCGHDLSSQEALIYEKRQIFEWPEVHLKVTEYRSEIKACPVCHAETKGKFPEEVKQAVQYGSHLKGLAVYFNQYQFLPYERLGEVFEVLCGQSISEGTLFNAVQSCGENLSEFEAVAKEMLKNVEVLHHDESGMRVEKKLHWVHSASTADWSWYQVHAKRGQEASAEIGILPEFAGILAHDHWKPYFQYSCVHALCNAHHLRELKFVEESYQQAWAGQMAELLREIKNAVEACPNAALSVGEIANFEKSYGEILEAGLAVNPLPEKPEKKRGRQKKSPARNLLERLSQYRPEVLRFMHDFRVPFDNNQAERDIRMVKLYQKISGCFRTMAGAQTFCRIRSYLSTLKKQGFNLINSLAQAIQGQPVIPSFTPT